MSKSKFDFKKVMIAVGAGATYGGAVQLAASKVQFVNDHYTKVRTGGALLLGAGLQYFGSKSPDMQTAGTALLGIAGDSGARWIANMIQGDGAGEETPAADSGETMQGLGKIKPRHRAMLENVCANVKKKGPQRDPRTSSGAPVAHVRPSMGEYGTGWLNSNVWAGTMGLM